MDFTPASTTVAGRPNPSLRLRTAVLLFAVTALLAGLVIPASPGAAQELIAEPVVLQLLDVHDDDLTITAGGYSANPVISLPDPDGEVGNLRRATVWIRMLNGACESGIRLALTSPSGTRVPVVPFDTCEAGSTLLMTEIEVPANGSGTWDVQFDYEASRGNRVGGYSVRALRFDALQAGIDSPLELATPGSPTLFAALDTGPSPSAAAPDVIAGAEQIELIDVFDDDVAIDTQGFGANPQVTLVDDAPADGRRLTIWIRTLGASCESDIALRVTAPHGGTFESRPYDTCTQVGDLLTIKINTTSYGSGDWTVEFDDVAESNVGNDLEFSVRGVRLDLVEGLTPTDEFGRPPLHCATTPVESADVSGDTLDHTERASITKSADTPELPQAALFEPGVAYWYEYISITDQLLRTPGSQIATSFEHDDQGAGDLPDTTPASGQASGLINRNHSRLRADVVLSAAGTGTSGAQWVQVDVLAACVQSWSEELADGNLATLADETAPSGAPTQADDLSSDYRGAFQFERLPDGAIGRIIHDPDTDAGLQMFREGLVNALPVSLSAARSSATIQEVDRTATQQSSYQAGRDDDQALISRTAEIQALGLTRRTDTTLDAAGAVSKVRGREELTLHATEAPANSGSTTADHGRPIPWADSTLAAPGNGPESPVDAYVLQTINIGRLATTAAQPGIDAEAASQRANVARVENTLTPFTAQQQLTQAESEKAPGRWAEGLELLELADAGSSTLADQLLPQSLRLLSSAIAADEDIANDAAMLIHGSMSTPYRSQVLVASLASSQTTHAQALLAAVVRDRSLPESVQLSAMVNALSVTNPSTALVDALIERGGSGSDRLSRSSLLIANGVASNAGDASAAARADSALSAAGEPRSTRVEDLRPIDDKAAVRPSSRQGDKVAPTSLSKHFQTCSGPAPAADQICWFELNCNEDDLQQCYEALESHCATMSSTQPPGWPHCVSFVWPNNDTQSGQGGTGSYTPPMPGDFVWDLVIGPDWAQGHAWLGIRPNFDARMASMKAEAGLEFRVQGEVKPLLHAQAEMQVIQQDDQPEDNWLIGDMEVGQIRRELALTASWKGTPILDQRVDFPCGIGASGGFDETTATGDDYSNSTDVDVPTGAQKLFDDIVAAGPGAQASVPVLGVISISVGINLGIRLSGSWAWSVDMCNFGIGGQLATAAGEVKVTGAVTVDAYAGVEVLLVEAGIGANVTIFKIDAPLKASLQLLVEQGSVRLLPCFSFDLNPTLFEVRVYAYARVFIKIPFIGKKIILWKWSGDLVNFNLGSELGMGPVTVFASDCDPQEPIPPQIVSSDGQGMSVEDGIVSRPEIVADGERLPVGFNSGATETDLTAAAGAVCSYYGLGASLTTPLKGPFGEMNVTKFAQWDPSSKRAERFGKPAKTPSHGSSTKPTRRAMQSDEGSWDKFDIDPSTEQLQTVVCAQSDNDANPDIAISAVVFVNGNGNGTTADDPGQLELAHNDTYTVQFEVTNTTGATINFDGASLDGVDISCTGQVLDQQTGVCETTFVATGNFALSNGADATIYDDLAADRMHKVTVHFTPEPGEDPIGAATHYWFEGLDPSTIDISAFVRVQIATEGTGGADIGAYADANFSPGPELSAPASVPVLLQIQSLGYLENVNVPAPFDVTCAPQNEDRAIYCDGFVTLPSGDGQHSVAISADRGPSADNAVVDLTTDWFFRYAPTPVLTIDAYVDDVYTSALPGARITDSAPNELRFRIGNQNATALDSVVASIRLEADGSLLQELNADFCTPIGSSNRTWECTINSTTIPSGLNALIAGTVEVQATHGSDVVTKTGLFWLDPRIENTSMTGSIDYPADGATFSIGENPNYTGLASLGTPTAPTGTGSFFTGGSMPAGNYSLDFGDAIPLRQGTENGMWWAELRPSVTAGQTTATVSVTLTEERPDMDDGITEIQVELALPDADDTIHRSEVLSMSAAGLTVVNPPDALFDPSGPVTLNLAGSNLDQLQDRVLVAPHGYSGLGHGIAHRVVAVSGSSVQIVPASFEDMFWQVHSSPSFVPESVTAEQEFGVGQDAVVTEATILCAEPVEVIDACAPLAVCMSEVDTCHDPATVSETPGPVVHIDDGVTPDSPVLDWFSTLPIDPPDPSELLGLEPLDLDMSAGNEGLGAKLSTDWSLENEFTLAIGPWNSWTPTLNEFAVGFKSTGDITAEGWAQMADESESRPRRPLYDIERAFLVGPLVPVTVSGAFRPAYKADIDGRVNIVSGFDINAGSRMHWTAAEGWTTSPSSNGTTLDVTPRDAQVSATADGNLDISGIFGLKLMLADAVGVGVDLEPTVEFDAGAEAAASVPLDSVAQALVDSQAWPFETSSYWDMGRRFAVEPKLAVQIPMFDTDLGDVGARAESDRLGISTGNIAQDVSAVVTELMLTTFGPADAAKVVAKCVALVERATQHPQESGISSPFAPMQPGQQRPRHWCNEVPIYMPGADLGLAAALRSNAIYAHPAWAVQARSQGGHERKSWLSNQVVTFQGPNGDPRLNVVFEAADAIMPALPGFGWTGNCPVKRGFLDIEVELPDGTVETQTMNLQCDEFPNASMASGGNRTGGPDNTRAIAVMMTATENGAEGSQLGVFYGDCNRPSRSGIPNDLTAPPMTKATADQIFLVVPVIEFGIDTSWHCNY